MYREISNKELKIQKSSGYIYFIDKKHPLAIGSAGYVYYHRHVYSISIGRWVTSEEHVHHKDEIKSNNSFNNLECLSIKEHAHMHFGFKKTGECLTCNKSFTIDNKTNKYCSTICYIKSKIKLDGLSKEELEILIWTEPFTKLAKQFNCSDNGIRKWAKRLGCIMPPPRFHVKMLSEEQKMSILKQSRADR